MTVSYTHLDVYKRQVGRGNGPEHLRRHEPEQLALARRQVVKLAVRGTHGGNERVVVGAVSYTHLDVYKRQPQAF